MTAASGSALTLDEIKKDISLLRQLGVNFVRGAHYPQVPKLHSRQTCLAGAKETGDAPTWKGGLRPAKLHPAARAGRHPHRRVRRYCAVSSSKAGSAWKMVRSLPFQFVRRREARDD
eukprot:79330-Pleurochrysis_carterae.AAC.1